MNSVGRILLSTYMLFACSDMFTQRRRDMDGIRFRTASEMLVDRGLEVVPKTVTLSRFIRPFGKPNVA